MKGKTLIVPCSGIGKTYGAVARESAYIVTEDLRPDDTRIMPLALVVLGEEDVRQALASSPAIAVDGCKLSCAAKVIAESGGSVVHALQVLDVYKRHSDLKPTGIAELNEAGKKLAKAVADEVSGVLDGTSGEENNA